MPADLVNNPQYTKHKHVRFLPTSHTDHDFRVNFTFCKLKLSLHESLDKSSSHTVNRNLACSQKWIQEFSSEGPS